MWLTNAAHAADADSGEQHKHRIATVSSTMVLAGCVVDLMLALHVGSQAKFPDQQAPGEDLWLRESMEALGVAGVLVCTPAISPASLRAALKLDKKVNDGDQLTARADQGIQAAC